MSVTRKALSAMGIEAEKIDQIIEMHSETVSGLKEQIAALKDDNDKLKADAAKLPDIQKELDTLKENVAAEAKEREGKDYDKLKEEFDNYKAEQKKKEVRAGKETAYREIMKDAGIDAKHFAKVLKYSDIDSVELDDKGKVKDAKTVIKALKDEWPELIATQQTKGADTATPPANTGTGNTAAEIFEKYKNDDAGLVKAIEANPGAFGLE